MTTIRSFIDEHCSFLVGNEGITKEDLECTQELWGCFLASKKLNKTLLCVLLGDFSVASPNKLESYGFSKILKSAHNTPEQMKKAQSILKLEILKQANQVSIN